ncbi:hypothetical protein KEJ21_00745 [Candidatus Bathyarchaeota archaeon]|nr:hypothetical protein [Candidatus Bathyarchaeota archaeon]MBS7631631.1 hypothetical protein [Candidatus Bathyarchaeota archaeon]
MTSSEAKQAWIQAKQASREAQQAYVQASIRWAANKTQGNEQALVDSGKIALQAALNEAEAWLVWVRLEVNENPEVPVELKERIQNDVDDNLKTVEDLRGEVAKVRTRAELTLVFLRMIGKYFELVADVARNTGLVWVHIANTYANTIENYEAEMRTAAEGIENNEDILEELDKAVEELENARDNIDLAEAEYKQVQIPGNPLLRFSSGNQYLRIARNKLLLAVSYLRKAYQLLMGAS